MRPPKWPWEGLGCLLPPTLLPAVKSTSAGNAQEMHFHLFWAWLVGKPRIQEVAWPISVRETASGGGREGARCKGLLSQPWEQLPSRGARRLPASQPLPSHPFRSLLADDVIHFIQRTSVLNDRNSGCGLSEAHQSLGAWVTK